MIRTIKGKVIGKTPPRVIVEAGGLGYGVFAPLSVFDEVAIEQEVFLYTYFHVGEDKQDLYGFLSAVDRDFFELLLTVSGVGPKVALSILSSHDTNILRSAIAENRPEIFASASGVGKKTAERIIVDLKSKIGIQPDLASDYGQTFEALRSLGYTANEAKQALAAVPKGVTDSAEQIRLALKALAK